MNIERRSLAIDEIESAVPLLAVESRSEDGSEREWVVGYAAKFGVLSLDLGDFVERIDPGAFGLVAERRGWRKPLETRALWNHDPTSRSPAIPARSRCRSMTWGCGTSSRCQTLRMEETSRATFGRAS
jgi:hypothetical protein